jgi:hypothetical protein
MLSFADIHQLNRIASYFQCECSTNSKKDLIQSILRAFQRTGLLEQYLQQLTIEDIRFLNILLHERKESYSLEELLARATLSNYELKKNEHKDSWNPREMVTKFLSQGWLFQGYTVKTKYLYHVPQDMKLKFTQVLRHQYQEQLLFTDDPPSRYKDEQKLLLEDTILFLTYVKNNDIEITSNGAMYKRTLQTITEMMHIKEEIIPKGSWRFGYGRRIQEYPNRFSLIYDYCYFHNYIQEQQNKLILSNIGQQQLVLNQVLDPIDFYRFWLRLYQSPIYNLQSIVQWINRLCERWVTIESLCSVITPLIKPYYYDSAEMILKQRVIMMMMHLGLLRIGEHHRWGTVIEMTKFGISTVKEHVVSFGHKVYFPEKPEIL